MRYLVFIIILLLNGAVQTYAVADNNTVWQKGNSFYREKRYDSAAFYYEQLASLKPRNAEIYYNLGNTYYRLNKIALAVLNYERALKINPDYKEAHENLMLTQERISNRIPGSGTIFFIRWWESITKPGLATFWSASALVIFTLFIALLFLKRFSKTTAGKIPKQLLGILVFVFCLLLVFSVFSTINSATNTTAVVMENDAPLMNVDLKGKPILLIPEGTTIKIKDERPDWFEISLPDGRTGWVRQNEVVKI